MIRVDRHRIEVPTELTGSEAKSWLDEIEAQLGEPRVKRSGRHLKFREITPEVRRAVFKLFHRKCAYCEQKLGTDQQVDVDRFRPRTNAVGMEGDVAPDHYWWLVYDWENMYLSCEMCSRKYKRSRFPIAGKERARPPARGSSLYPEEALLLDPCDERPDRNPEHHLVYEPQGNVYSQTEQGRVTIEVIGLNRDELRRRRMKHYESVDALIGDVNQLLADLPPGSKRKDELESLFRPIRAAISPEAEFAGLARQLVRQSGMTGFETELGDVERVSKTAARQVKSSYRKKQKEEEAYSLVEEDVEGYYLGTKYIERVEIENFSGLRRLELDLKVPEVEDPYTMALGMDRPGVTDESTASEPEPTAPWTMLLGENATGKSSVLKAIALALVGEEYRLDLADPHAEDYVRRPRCKRGEVVVHLTEPSEPQRLGFRVGESRFEGSKDVKVLLLGYGSTRLLPRPSHPAPTGRQYGRVENLFDPFVPVIDANRFLNDLYRNDEVKFRFVLDAVERLLGLGEDERIFPAEDPDSHEMMVHLAGATIPLSWLSDGYQSLLALACDIMEKLLQRWDSMSVAEGVVLLDEIGAHMHPRWRMRVVRRLRETFPRVQFIATTHDPLCLRWLRTGEVIVMRRDADEHIVAVQEELPQIGGMPVDQLLTSEHFGLSATIDPELEDLFDEYHVLLSMRRLTPKQRDRLNQLKATLHQLDQLGSTRRERLMLEAIDRHLANESRNLKDPTKYMADLERKLDRILEGTS